MTGIAASIILQASLAATATPTLDDAMKMSEKSGKPVLVLIGADWCRYCKVVERSALPKLKESGLMDKVHYVFLDYDRDAKLRRQLLRGQVIPEMILIRKTSEGWRRQNLGGMEMFTPRRPGQSQQLKLATIENFIKAWLPKPAVVAKKPVKKPATKQGDLKPVTVKKATKPAPEKP